MLGNTLVLPQVGGDITLTKINQDQYASEYLFRDSLVQYRARIRHTTVPPKGSTPAKDRHNFEVVKTTFATDTVPESEQKAYFVLEQEPKNTSVALFDAMCDLSIATSNAFLISLIKWES